MMNNRGLLRDSLLCGLCASTTRTLRFPIISSPRPTLGSEYYLVAKCGDFTVGIGVAVAGASSTISGNHEFFLRPIENDDRPIGFHLPECVQAENEDAPNSPKSFRIVTISRNTSMAHMLALELIFDFFHVTSLGALIPSALRAKQFILGREFELFVRLTMSYGNLAVVTSESLDA